MSWDWDIDFNSGDRCPSCGSYNTTIKKVYEDSDADNRRGRWVNYLECLDCDYEEC